VNRIYSWHRPDIIYDKSWAILLLKSSHMNSIGLL
jgi:hypothetical protein